LVDRAYSSFNFLATLIWFPQENLYLPPGPHDTPPAERFGLWANKGLQKKTDEVGTLYRFRITSPWARGEEQEDRWQERTEGVVWCQSQTPPLPARIGGTEPGGGAGEKQRER
jgi:hypothetical protein